MAEQSSSPQLPSPLRPLVPLATSVQSDCTVPTSNRAESDLVDELHPPSRLPNAAEVRWHLLRGSVRDDADGSQDDENDNGKKRSVFGTTVSRRYMRYNSSDGRPPPSPYALVLGREKQEYEAHGLYQPDLLDTDDSGPQSSTELRVAASASLTDVASARGLSGQKSSEEAEYVSSEEAHRLRQNKSGGNGLPLAAAGTIDTAFGYDRVSMSRQSSGTQSGSSSGLRSSADTVHHDNFRQLSAVRADDGAVDEVLVGPPTSAENPLKRVVSDLTPPPSPTASGKGQFQSSSETEEVGCATPINDRSTETPACDMSPITPGNMDEDSRKHYGSTMPRINGPRKHSQIHPVGEDATSKKTMSVHETLHAQSLILALAFLAVWSPQNLMAPNLTQMAAYFHFGPSQRDLYLGANIAFATGVLSLPVSAFIGFFADIVSSRKRLYAFTVLVGGISSVCTGLSTTYAQLYFARFVNGGCMSGCVPVAFSLLGDLFDTKDRNAASSGLTAMMGAGIILGQVYAGAVGDDLGWKHPFYLSGLWTVLSAILVLIFVQEPVRGGKEKVLQEMLSKGTRYDRKLTVRGFLRAMRHNESNVILMWQGFFSSVPWGVIFVFLNDYLSQERGLSVPDATFLVFMFGIGCAVGGVLGGYLGQITTQMNRSYMPLFMAFTTFLGIAPFLGLLNGTFHSADLLGSFYALSGGLIASLPSVNVRPCLINVNPPETRGAALTAANLIINFARGAGPSVITTMSAIWGVSRQYSFNATLIVFWTITAIQLCFLAKSLPKDQDEMESELAQYAASAINRVHVGASVEGSLSCMSFADDDTQAGTESIVSIEDRRTSFDAGAARETLIFFGDSLKEIGDELRHRHHHRDEYEVVPDGEVAGRKTGKERRDLWRSQQQANNSLTDGVQHQGQVPTSNKGTVNIQSPSNVNRLGYQKSVGTNCDDDRGPVLDMDRGKQFNSHSANVETLL